MASISRVAGIWTSLGPSIRACPVRHDHWTIWLYSLTGLKYRSLLVLAHVPSEIRGKSTSCKIFATFPFHAILPHPAAQQRVPAGCGSSPRAGRHALAATALWTLKSIDSKLGKFLKNLKEFHEFLLEYLTFSFENANVIFKSRLSVSTVFML